MSHPNTWGSDCALRLPGLHKRRGIITCHSLPHGPHNRAGAWGNNYTGISLPNPILPNPYVFSVDLLTLIDGPGTRALLARGGHSHRPCTSTRDWGQNVGQVVKAENLSSQRVKANFSWSKLVQRSTSGGCGLISFEVGQGSRPTFRCSQEVKA